MVDIKKYSNRQRTRRRKSSLERQKYISERKRTIHTVYMGGGVDSSTISNYKADSIEHVEIDI